MAECYFPGQPSALNGRGDYSASLHSWDLGLGTKLCQTILDMNCDLIVALWILGSIEL